VPGAAIHSNPTALDPWSVGVQPLRRVAGEGHNATGPTQSLASGRRSVPGRAAYIARYLGPLPPSRGVHRGPTTSVALQSTQLGGFTRSSSPTRSYTPAGQTWA
jgi:hypothetical protein